MTVAAALVAVVGWTRIHPPVLVAFLVAALLVTVLTRGTDSDSAMRIASISYLPVVVAATHGAEGPQPSRIGQLLALLGLACLALLNSEQHSDSHRDPPT